MEFKGDRPIYIQLADHLSHLIDAGAYEEGKPMPSVREVALFERINPQTVARAYSLLIEQGKVTSIPKKGYFPSKGGKVKDDEIESSLKDLIKKGYSIKEIETVLKTMKGEGHED